MNEVAYKYFGDPKLEVSIRLSDTRPHVRVDVGINCITLDVNRIDELIDGLQRIKKDAEEHDI